MHPTSWRITDQYIYNLSQNCTCHHKSSRGVDKLLGLLPMVFNTCRMGKQVNDWLVGWQRNEGEGWTSWEYSTLAREYLPPCIMFVDIATYLVWEGDLIGLLDFLFCACVFFFGGGLCTWFVNHFPQLDCSKHNWTQLTICSQGATMIFMKQIKYVLLTKHEREMFYFKNLLLLNIEHFEGLKVTICNENNLLLKWNIYSNTWLLKSHSFINLSFHLSRIQI